MGKPKKRTSSRRTGTRRADEVLQLARTVNAKSPVKVRTTPFAKPAKNRLRKLSFDA